MILLNILTNNVKNIVLHVIYQDVGKFRQISHVESQNNTLVFDLQLHNVTLALDLLDNTGLQVSGVDPQGEDITGLSVNTHSASLTTDLCQNQNSRRRE